MLVAIAAAVGAALAANDPAAPPASFRAPYQPSEDGELLQQVPAAANPKVREIRMLRAALDKAPKNLEDADRLARAYIDFGREVGDAHYAGYAEAVIAPWMAQKPPPVAALVVHATILQYRHLFAEARAELRDAVARAPDNAQAWLTLATLDMVQGDYRSANTDCVAAARTGGTTPGLACTAELRSYIGQAKQADTLLGLIALDAPGLTPQVQAWIAGLRAETSTRLGDWEQAETYFRKALGYTPVDDFLLVSYADFLLDRGRPQEVLKLLANQVQSDTAFLRIALAQAALRSPDQARYTFAMAARFEALALRGMELYGREHARFALELLHDPDTALDLAQKNWRVQRAPGDARVYLEAALAANQPQTAREVLAFLDENKLQDPIIEVLAAKLRAQLAAEPKS